MTAAAAINKLRILFVDDEQDLRNIMKFELPRMGHEVVLCEDGQAALKALGSQTFDAAIVDLLMPGLSGWDVIEHIKKVSPETEIIISTAHGDMDSAIHAVRVRGSTFHMNHRIGCARHTAHTDP